MVGFDDFKKLEIRIGQIKEASDHPDAERLYVLKVDIGEKIIQLVAGIRKHYSLSELPGKKIVVLVNLEPRQIRGITSEGMLLAASKDETLALLGIDKDIDPGAEVR